MIYAVLILSSFIAAFVSGAAGFGGALLLVPVVTACIGAELAVPVLTIAQLIGNLSRMAFGIKQIDWKSGAYGYSNSTGASSEIMTL